MDPKFPFYWKPYILQSYYDAGTVFFITLLLSENPVVIASIGATAFIVFALPSSRRRHFLRYDIGCYSNSAVIAIINSVLSLTIIAYLSKPYLEDLV